MMIVESKGVRYFFQSYGKSLRISKTGQEELLQEHFQISFEEAVLRFYKSETYKTLQETENGLWAESAEYIADRYYEETAG